MKTTLQSGWRSLLKNELTGPTLLEISGYPRGPRVGCETTCPRHTAPDAKAKLANYSPGNIRVQQRDTRRSVEFVLKNLQSELNGEPRLVRAKIMKHVQKITLTPDLLRKTHAASGNWDLLGSVATRLVPGARIELATTAFSGRRSTNELPRQ